ncbi:UDP-glucuronosyltransferase 2C1-like isoform X2 [Apostichopus japonicus]|uniref:UDP-glucuronosyltransferase 2C1-like isoform X2 n=1 Tax=Stichopus japonicus TaxID=307972 RepID=UPI003AB1160B
MNSMGYPEDTLFRRAPGYTRIFILLIAFAVTCSYSGKVLMPATQTISTPSHQMVLSTLTERLVRSDHNVTLLINDLKGTKGYANGSYSQFISYNVTSCDSNQTDTLMKLMHEMAFEPVSIVNRMQIASTVLFTQFASCQDLWNDDNVLLTLKQSKFDLVIDFPFSACGVLIAHYLQVPFVVVVPTMRLPTFHEGLYGMPYPSSYVPFDLFGLDTDEMSFFRRMVNFIKPLVSGILMKYVLFAKYHKIQVDFDIEPDKTIAELYADASLILTHVNEGTDYPRPRTPHYIPIGGLLARPAEPLPQGSAITGVRRRDLLEVFARVFSKLPQRVLWRHQGEPPTDIGENTKLTDWLPQNDVLGHPKTRLLIYHGGSSGVIEAIYHGVPMVIIPLFGDQSAHAASIQKKGMGLILDKNNISEETLMEVIQTVINNPSFKERVQHYSRIHHDAPMTPLQRAIHWMEHVMKFGADHLRPRSAHMSSIELYNVDVTVFLILLCLIGLYIDYVILKRLCNCCCKGKAAKISKSKGE